MLPCYPHFHSHLEIIWIRKGSVDITIGEKLHTLTAGQCALVFPGEIHSYPHTSDDNDVLLIVCSLHLLGQFKYSLTSKSTFMPIQHISDMYPDASYALQSILDTNDRVITVHFNWSLFNEKQTIVQHISILLQLFLSGFLSYCQLENKTNSVTLELSQQIVNYIMTEYHNPITLDDIAKALDISRFKISRIFSNHLHISFTKYITTLRINEAKYLLANTQQSITNIAYNCGFGTIRTFDRAFLENTGQSPKHFRHLNNPNF